MDYDQMIKDKQRASSREETGAYTPNAGLVGVGECKRASLRERVAGQLRHAQQEAGKAGRLMELDMLLDKNPDIARILDLVEEVRG